MTKVTQKTIYRPDVKIMGTLILLIFVSGGSWYTSIGQIKQNTDNIIKLSKQSSDHIKDYQKMNNVVIKSSEKLSNIEQMLKDNKSDLKYLIRKADNK